MGGGVQEEGMDWSEQVQSGSCRSILKISRLNRFQRVRIWQDQSAFFEAEEAGFSCVPAGTSHCCQVILIWIRNVIGLDWKFVEITCQFLRGLLFPSIIYQLWFRRTCEIYPLNLWNIPSGVSVSGRRKNFCQPLGNSPLVWHLLLQNRSSRFRLKAFCFLCCFFTTDSQNPTNSIWQIATRQNTC